MNQNTRNIIDNTLFVLISLSILIAVTYFAYKKITDIRFPIKGKVAFVSNRFESDPKVLMSNRGTCIYENGKVEKLFKDIYNPRWSRDGKAIVRESDRGQPLKREKAVIAI